MKTPAMAWAAELPRPMASAPRSSASKATVSSPSSGARAAAGPAMPLSLVKPGLTVEVRRVRAGEAAKHLASLGFVAGAQVRVVNQTSTGTIVSIKGAQLGLDRDTARMVMCA